MHRLVGVGSAEGGQGSQKQEGNFLGQEAGRGAEDGMRREGDAAQGPNIQEKKRAGNGDQRGLDQKPKGKQENGADIVREPWAEIWRRACLGGKSL